MEILYFAWVRERIGMGSESLSPPDGVKTVAALLDWLATRSAGHAAALADRSAIRIAVDQDFVGMYASIAEPCEVAIFPPVTGG